MLRCHAAWSSANFALRLCADRPKRRNPFDRPSTHRGTALPETKHRIKLTFDNIADYMPLAFAEALVRGVPKRDLRPGDPLVTKLWEWVVSYADYRGERFTLSPW